ncbi:uncharacterized protein LOC142322160 isoform X3 [Lycorma delicatula]|uniref:uncharacterized protein LOC142322160 isoform X3 n=1 Tax=Lycorma delicatula TaxID=130591 RepID=UPI003F5148A9
MRIRFYKRFISCLWLMDQMSLEEIQHILEVLFRDAELRKMEVQRVRKLQASIQSAEKERADKWSCARCGRVLSRVRTGPSQRLQCARCSLHVCRHCCSKTSAASWICSSCRKYRDVTLQSGEWFYEQLKKRFHSTVATIPGNENQDVEVRDFLERIVEDVVGGELDSVSLRPLSSHPEYVKFCEIHHDELALMLAKYSLSLQMALTDKSLPENESASTLHEELKELIKRIIKEAMTLPTFQNYSNGSIKESLNGEVEDIEKKSYEDILATAIINKSGLQDTNSNVLRHNLRRRKLTGGVGERSNSSDSDGSGSAAFNDNYSWSGSSRTDPLSLTIEECIEEVVTKYSTDEDPEEHDTELKHFLSGLKFRKRQRAPFPEFGMDVVDKRHSSSSSEEEDNEDEEEEEEDGPVRAGVEVISPVESWEENWLFQRRRLKTAGLAQSMPVPMLVPNPSQNEPRARIGDIDVDETSDLSDCSDNALEDIIDGSDPELKGTKSNFTFHSKTSSDDNTDSDDEFILKSYSKNAIKSIDNIKPKVNGICSGNVNHGNTIINDVNNTINNEKIQEQLNNTVIEAKSFQSSPNLTEARNNELIAQQVDSGEGSLEMQQDRDYTVEYDAPVQVHVKSNESVRPAEKTNSDNITSTDYVTTSITKDDNDKETTCDKQKLLLRKSQPIQSDEAAQKLNGLNGDGEINEKENFDVLMAPPRPGTIAEREYLKWQKAVPLSNNPYSKENIERRRRERLLLSRQSSSDVSVEFPELTGANESSVVHLDCSGRKPDYKQYGRDYYINNGGQKKENERKEVGREKVLEAEMQRNSSEKSNVANTQMKEEDKPQVSVRVEVEVGRWPSSSSSSLNSNETSPVSSVETRTHVKSFKDEQHMTTITSTASSKNNDNKMNQQHQVTTVSTWSNKNDKDKKNYITLPSVKQLAKQFSTNDNNEQVIPVTPSAGLQRKLEVPTSPIKQVHSLTARCISKEFREGLRAANQPKIQQMKPVEKIENNSGNISDDSGTASPTPSSGCNPKLYNSIAFWEQMKLSRQ